MQHLDVVIVGAGPAGIGMALELNNISGLEYGVLESDRIGESFRRWPAQTRFITPSFYSNPFGLADLNAVDANSSPAICAGAEHLSGAQYADYLSFVAEANSLPIVTGCKVLAVEPNSEGGFHLNTEFGAIYTQCLIWACGEYQFPDLKPFPGGHLCLHYAHIEDWQALPCADYTVIGGYESGLDSAINLLKLGCKVRLLVRKPTWDLPDVHDPSQVLSPYTRQRLREVENAENLEIIFDVNVIEVTGDIESGFQIIAADSRSWHSTTQPILGTGFQSGGGARQIKGLWTWDSQQRIQLSAIDESISTPGLFLVGPQVRHDNGVYCFIYKFRQRFTGIASQIALDLALDYVPSEAAGTGSWGPFGNSECCEGCEC